MSTLARFFASVVAVAVITHVLVLNLAPWIIMDKVMTAIEAEAGWNTAMPSSRPDHTSRGVVRPSPDLIYTICIFDVSEGPVLLSAPVQDSYVSLSGFAANTDNFFAINDSKIQSDASGQRRFEVVLRGDAMPPAPIPENATVVHAPTNKGIVLFRSLVGSEEQLKELYKIQAQQRCDPL